MPLRLEGDRLIAEDGEASYPVVREVPFLLARQPHLPHLIDEYFRYSRFFERSRKGLYEEERVELKLEQIKAMVQLLREYFESVVCSIDFSTKPLVLDTAAGMMETTFELERRGARVVATDFSPHELFNPRIYSFFDDTDYDWSKFQLCDGHSPIAEEDIRFQRVLGSTERLPFATGTFDVVFTRSSLHHLKDINRGLAEMARVLKPGGQLVVAGECIRPFWETEAEYLEDIIDYQEGIDEQMRTWGEYHSALKAAGLTDIEAVPMLASAGKRMPKVFQKFHLRDPFNRLERKRLCGAKLNALHFMGCVLGWTARRGGSQIPFEELAPEEGLTIADKLTSWESHEGELRRMGLDAHSSLPSSYTYNTLPQPECYGFGLIKEGDTHARTMYRSGAFVFGGVCTSGSTIELELHNEMHSEECITFELFPEQETSTETLEPGHNKLILEFEFETTASAHELRFELSPGAKIFFRSLKVKLKK